MGVVPPLPPHLMPGNPYAHPALGSMIQNNTFGGRNDANKRGDYKKSSYPNSAGGSGFNQSYGYRPVTGPGMHQGGHGAVPGANGGWYDPWYNNGYYNPAATGMHGAASNGSWWIPPAVANPTGAGQMNHGGASHGVQLSAPYSRPHGASQSGAINSYSRNRSLWIPNGSASGSTSNGPSGVSGGGGGGKSHFWSSKRNNQRNNASSSDGNKNN